MQKHTLKIILSVLTIMISFLLWWSTDSIGITDSLLNWIIFFVLIFAYFSVLLLDFIIIEKKRLLICVAIASFAISLIFAFRFSQIIFVALGILLVLWMCRAIYVEKKLIVPMEVWRLARPIRISLVLLLSLVISGQFYSNVVALGINNLIPEITFGNTEKRIVANAISVFDKSIHSEEIEEMTVDEFVLRKIRDNNEFASLRSDLVEITLNEGRKDFSSIVEREVDGNEKVFDIFSEVVNNKINDFFRTNIESKYMMFVPWTILAMFFLMTFSVISFMAPLMIVVTKILFVILLKIRLVEIEKIAVEKEILKV